MSYLFVNLGELLKIVLKKGNFLFLCRAAAGVVRVHLSALHGGIKHQHEDWSNTPQENYRLPLLVNEHLQIAAVYLFHSGSQVLDKELPQVVQSLQLLGLGFKKRKIN